MAFLSQFFGYLNALTWGWALVPLLVVIGIYVTSVASQRFSKERELSRL
jgi:AGCS family alanine or glycine:cation symporter